MSELTTKPEVDHPASSTEPSVNLLHDPDTALSSTATKPNSEPSEMTADVSGDTAATPAPAQHSDSPHETSATVSPTLDPPAQTEVTSPPAVQNDPPVDPHIASLVAIFPTFDHDLLRDVLNECNNNEEQAVDVLLGMSDPNHVPSTTVANVRYTRLR